jgi:hypothetical protein
MSQSSADDPKEAFLRRLIGQLDPQIPARDRAARQEQILCGRWLAVRRLRRGLTALAIAQATGLPEQALLFLETGLGDAELIPSQTRRALIGLLANDQADAPRVELIVSIALGIVIPDVPTLESIAADLRRPGDEPLDT